ncbi:hypothetical protein RAA17_01150 [Komagataeibacter rhaeticus]|nr:hypothetical protein [Komagataeibacter rhaeticus]
MAILPIIRFPHACLQQAAARLTPPAPGPQNWRVTCWRPCMPHRA